MSGTRTLLVTEREVSPESRAQYVESLAAVRSTCTAAGVQFWAFEHASDGGRFIEFAEAKDESLLDALDLDSTRSSRWRALEIG